PAAAAGPPEVTALTRTPRVFGSRPIASAALWVSVPPEIPRYGWATLPVAIICWETTLTTFDGTAKPTPEFARTGDSMAVLTPMTSPFRLISGPPELPGLIAASVWITSGI